MARWRLPWSHSRVLSSVKQVAQLTGPTSINHTHTLEVAGQNLGSMFDAVGRTWFLFGDTLPRDGGTEWRSNTLAYTSDANGFGFSPRASVTHDARQGRNGPRARDRITHQSSLQSA